jgi:hypothetical protein
VLGPRAQTLLLCAMASLSLSTIASAGSARDYLNAPVDSWLTLYNAASSTSVTPEDGTDISSRNRSDVFSRSVVMTRTMDLWGRTGGFSVVLPYAVVRNKLKLASSQRKWPFRYRLSLANEHLRRPRADARAVPLVHPRDSPAFIYMSGRRSVRIVPAPLSIRAPIGGRSRPPLTTATRLTKSGRGWSPTSRYNSSRTTTTSS